MNFFVIVKYLVLNAIIGLYLVVLLQNVDLRLKWPNDIYFGNTMKLGGVIVKSSIMADVIHANIGMLDFLNLFIYFADI